MFYSLSNIIHIFQTAIHSVCIAPARKENKMLYGIL